MSRVHLMFVLSACASGASPCELSCKRLSPPHRFVYFLDVYLLFWCKLFTKLSKISRSFCFGSLSLSLSLSFSCCYSDVEPSLALSLFLCCCCECCSIPPLFSSLCVMVMVVLSVSLCFVSCSVYWCDPGGFVFVFFAPKEFN